MFSDAFDETSNMRPPRLFFRHEPSNRIAVTGDDDRLAALDLIEQLGELRLGYRGLNLPHNILTGQFDQSIYTPFSRIPQEPRIP